MSPRHTIVLPNRRSVTIAAYVHAYRRLLAMPPDTWIDGRDWDGFGCTAADVLRDMRRAMVDRINRHLPGYGRERKWGWQWQCAMARVAWNLNGRRIVSRTRDVPPDYRARLAHRLHDD